MSGAARARRRSGSPTWARTTSTRRSKQITRARRQGPRPADRRCPAWSASRSRTTRRARLRRAQGPRPERERSAVRRPAARRHLRLGRAPHEGPGRRGEVLRQASSAGPGKVGENEPMQYWHWQNAGKDIGGMMTLPMPRACRPHWLGYIAVTDVDASTAQGRAARRQGDHAGDGHREGRQVLDRAGPDRRAPSRSSAPRASRRKRNAKSAKIFEIKSWRAWRSLRSISICGAQVDTPTPTTVIPSVATCCVEPSFGSYWVTNVGPPIPSSVKK